MTEQMPARQPFSPRQAALARAVVDLEEHVAQRGWDAPVGVFALVRTAAALEQDPALAELFDDAALAQAQHNPQSVYNLLLAIIAGIGVAMRSPALMLAGAGSMIVAAAALALKSPKHRGAAMKQCAFAVIGVAY